MLRHLGGGQRWVAEIVRARAAEPPSGDHFRDLSSHAREDAAVPGPWLAGSRPTGGRPTRSRTGRLPLDSDTREDGVLLRAPVRTRDAHPPAPMRRSPSAGRSWSLPTCWTHGWNSARCR
ncbi:hypothetical protein ACQPZP_18725 [Spirillospora sp. CA-142024]|uniref:hypothetical protein n=1 Tax=Spirillospora sp. CA-142024 TaxID=3240036 RepID=UPI003D932E41